MLLGLQITLVGGIITVDTNLNLNGLEAPIFLYRSKLLLCANYFLWEIHFDFSAGYSLQMVLYTFIVYPGTVLMFLANYPKSMKGKILHYIKWIGVYIGVEYIYYLLGLITFDHGWHLGWSFLFVCMMFPMFRLHHINPLVAYLISIPITLILVWIFNVPVSIPIQERY